ncbi:MAG: hypothetical protein J2P53_08495 [Bradyrhizobiaceae bacterium]|nr:hypothetical protein [Bradyrhizobiaceae bacterium]
MKSRIVERLGKAEVLLPSLVAEGLAANDRVKVHLSTLQAAADHARNPGTAAADLAAECRAAGLEPAAAFRLVNGARLTADGRITAPHLAELGRDILAGMDAMIHAVEAASPAEGRRAAARLAATGTRERLASLSDIGPQDVSELTAVRGRDDSLHRLIMDLHKTLNRLAAGAAEETIAGAHCYGLRPQDRGAVEAFMRGLQSTAHLKFDHPGLATTAVRTGSRLTIQNDIGVTDAHVIVVTVEGDAVAITHTDVHRARARFFTRMLNPFPVRWSGIEGNKEAEGLGDGGAFKIVTGRCDAPTAESRNAVLESIGASLVFLIDWNKARKVLRSFVGNVEAVRVLDWAARNRVGHRAFLELGGRDLITGAVHSAAPARIGFGESFDAVLGRNVAVDFLKGVLRISTEALLEGRSLPLVRDRIEADLVRSLKRVDSALLAIVVRQAGLAREVAAAVVHHVAGLAAGVASDGAALAAKARRIEEKADRVAREARTEVARLDAGRTIEQLVSGIEDVVDELEQAAFIASLLPATAGDSILRALSQLCAVVLTGTETAASGVDAAGEVPEGRRADSEDALAAIDRLVDVEHEADAAERSVTAQVLRGGLDFASSTTALELARALERATDRMAGFGHLLRAHVLADLAT